MWKIAKSEIKSFGAANEIQVVKTGFLKYEAVQQNGVVIARGLKLRKYYNPFTGIPGSGAVPGRIMRDCGHWNDLDRCWIEGTNEYFLALENPKTYDFDIVCIWK